MKAFAFIVALSAVLLAVPNVHAQQAPAGATGQCRDGSYTTHSGKRGACRGHKGVKTWFAAMTDAAAGSEAASTEPVASTSRKAASKGKRSMAWTRPAAEAAPGGGAGKVWVNKGSKVYHCQGDKWYGRTRHGSYMSEADAKAKGYHGPRGKSCSA
ncbi:DUF3761 domain-containing protein [Dyella sp. A6]|uniref:DUF3761 domain-containing protein n=1 Tax=Dyella aluminiiresistens TaxID=3069105 RepID=UPI002E75F553|nr:DUF3761 domain-containing protein [Dyella sp. A6]